jgi:hypothetical protein
MRGASRPCGFGYGESGAPDGGKPYRREGTCRAGAGPGEARPTVAGRCVAEAP